MRSLKYWNLCRLNCGHHGKADTSISDIVEMKEMNDIVVHDHIKTRWLDLYPQYDSVDDSGLQHLHSSLHICRIDWFEGRI